MRIIEPNKDAHRCPINPGNTLDDIRTDGTIYFDDGLKEIKNGKRYFKNCWRAEITIAGQRYRHRGKDRLDCESWLKLVKQGKIKPTDNKADWWRMEQHKDEEARYDEMIVTAAEESNLLYEYHHTNNLEPIFKYVTERLLPHCIYYCCHSLKMGRATSLDAAVTATSIFLTRIAAGKPITNFTFSVKKMLRVRKETGSFSYYDIDAPGATVTTKDRMAIVNPEFLTAFYGNGSNHSIEEPAPTITTKDRFGVVTTKFLDMQYGNGTPASTDEPSPAVTTNPKQNLVTAEQFLMNPQYQSEGSSIEKPCFTLIARMDKMPPYLISTDKGIGIEIYEEDSPATVRIKEFMALYGIVDVKMRMLNVSELKRIMGFPDTYVLIGTQAEQKKYIGNAVEVNMSRVLCEALCEALDHKFNTKKK